MGVFTDLREELFSCRELNRTFDEVNACVYEATKIATQAMVKLPHVNEILGCQEKLWPHPIEGYMQDLVAIAEAGSFDTEDIAKASTWMCKAGSIKSTSIDRIELKSGQTYLIKHSGSASEPIGDAQTWMGVQLVADILGEEIPKLIWASGKTGRFAMTKMPVSQGQHHYKELLPHDLVTTLIFETIIGDWDRAKDENAVRVGELLFGHLDFAGEHTGGQPQVSSGPAFTFIRDARSMGLQAMEKEYPGITAAVEQGARYWSTDWRGKLQKLNETGRGFRGSKSWSPITAPERLEAVDQMFEDLFAHQPIALPTAPLGGQWVEVDDDDDQDILDAIKSTGNFGTLAFQFGGTDFFVGQRVIYSVFPSVGAGTAIVIAGGVYSTGQTRKDLYAVDIGGFAEFEGLDDIKLDPAYLDPMAPIDQPTAFDMYIFDWDYSMEGEENCFRLDLINQQIKGALGDYRELLHEPRENMSHADIGDYFSKLCIWDRSPAKKPPFVGVANINNIMRNVDAGNVAVKNIVRWMQDEGTLGTPSPLCSRPAEQFVALKEAVQCTQDLCKSTTGQKRTMWSAIEALRYTSEQADQNSPDSIPELRATLQDLGKRRDWLVDTISEISPDNHCNLMQGSALLNEDIGSWNNGLLAAYKFYLAVENDLTERLTDMERAGN